jgi:hypothetical protein
MSTLEVPGAILHYETQGSGPILVLIPGANGETGIFKPLADALLTSFKRTSRRLAKATKALMRLGFGGRDRARRYCRARPCLVGRCLGLGGAPANRVL